MKCIVTGSAGYIGSILAKKLTEAGHDVVGIDKLDVRHGLKKFIVADYANELALKKHIDDTDVIFHMAASSLLGPSVKDPIAYYQNNTSKTTSLLSILQKRKFKGRLIFASSAAVYGDAHGKVSDGFGYEKYYPINPYGWSKLQTEQQLNDCAIYRDLDFLAFRFFNVVGAYRNLGQQLTYPHILTSMCRAAFNEDSFYINGYDFNTDDGTCVRDYVHVEDVVDVLIKSAFVDREEIIWNFFNVCTGIETSNLELVEAFKETTGIFLDAHYKERREGDPAYLVGHNYSAVNQFGFKPKHDLKSMITSAWNYFKENQK